MQLFVIVIIVVLIDSIREAPARVMTLCEEDQIGLWFSTSVPVYARQILDALRTSGSRHGGASPSGHEKHSDPLHSGRACTQVLGRPAKRSASP